MDPAVEEADEEEDDDDVVDLDEELHPDDVEEALDVVLRERTVAAGLEGEEDDDEPDEPGEGGTKIVPRRENEFLLPELLPRAPSAPARRREPHDLPRLRVTRSDGGAPRRGRRHRCVARPRRDRRVDLGPLACVAFVPLFVAWRGRRPARHGRTTRSSRRSSTTRC